jgi:hypothetical protein
LEGLIKKIFFSIAEIVNFSSAQTIPGRLKGINLPTGFLSREDGNG